MKTDFSWSLFELTGNIDAYLLVRDLERSGFCQQTDQYESDTESGSFDRNE